jgi:hypothetical protein
MNNDFQDAGDSMDGADAVVRPDSIAVEIVSSTSHASITS